MHSANLKDRRARNTARFLSQTLHPGSGKKQEKIKENSEIPEIISGQAEDFALHSEK